MNELILVEEYGPFEVFFEALPEYELPGDFEESDQKEIIDQIEHGSLVLFTAKVSICIVGIELATAYLGLCIYKSEKDFYTTYKNEYFNDMRDTAIDEAMETLKAINKKVYFEEKPKYKIQKRLYKQSDQRTKLLNP